MKMARRWERAVPSGDFVGGVGTGQPPGAARRPLLLRGNILIERGRRNPAREGS